jgi:hypothetical protein
MRDVRSATQIAADWSKDACEHCERVYDTASRFEWLMHHTGRCKEYGADVQHIRIDSTKRKRAA